MALLLQFGAAIAAPPVKADTVYTWNTDESTDDKISGLLRVSSDAMTRGLIVETDVIGFGFQLQFAGGNTWSLDKLFNETTLSIPISTTTAGPTALPSSGPSSYLRAVGSDPNFSNAPLQFQVSFDANWDQPNGETLLAARGGSLPLFVQYTGHWSIATTPGVAPVPEPLSAVLMAVGAVSGIAYAWVRKRRSKVASSATGFSWAWGKN